MVLVSNNGSSMINNSFTKNVRCRIVSNKGFWYLTERKEKCFLFHQTTIEHY